MNYLKNFWLRNVAVMCLMTAVFVTSTMTAWAKTGTLAGELVVSGSSMNNLEPSVLINGENSLNGRTVFSGSVIKTSEKAATIKLGKLGYLNLSPNSVLTLNFDETSISGTISEGEVQVFNSKNIKVNIEKTGNAKVMAAQQDDDDDDNNSPLVPILVFAGIVTTAVIFVITNQDDSLATTSPVR